MKRLLWLVLLLPVLIFVFPGPPSATLRHFVALKLVEAQSPNLAKPIYAIGKTYKEPLAWNNWLVLDYREKRSLPGLSKSERRENRNAMRAAFNAVGEAGLGAGYYNAALFCFKCGYKTNGYKKSVEWLERAIVLDDPLALDALALMSKKNKTVDETKRIEMLKAAAERGNPVAARYLAKDIFDKGTPEYEKYVLISARAGNADAQYMAADMPGHDRIYWLERAASAKASWNVKAGIELAHLYEDAGRYKDARKWMSMVGRPRDVFETQIDIRKDGLRWRGQRTTRVGDYGSSYAAATAAAGMKMAGIGGSVSRSEAQTHLDYAYKYQYAPDAIIMNIINSYNGEFIPEKTLIRANVEAFEEEFVKKFKTWVIPLLQSGDVEYFTKFHFYRWLNYNTEKGLPTTLMAERNLEELVKQCRTQNCFFINRNTTIPKLPNTGHPVTFVVPKGVVVRKSPRDRNTYISIESGKL